MNTRFDKDPRYWAMTADPRDGHPDTFGSESAAVVDDEVGGIVLYGTWDTCVKVAELLNVVEELNN